MNPAINGPGPDRAATDDGDRAEHQAVAARLASALRAGAAGSYLATAAVELLIAHDRWLHRTDFLEAAVEVIPTVTFGRYPIAFVAWPGALAADLPASSSERQILAICAELVGVDTGQPLGDLLSGFDEANTTLVLQAVRHACRGVEGRPVIVQPALAARLASPSRRGRVYMPPPWPPSQWAEPTRPGQSPDL